MRPGGRCGSRVKRRLRPYQRPIHLGAGRQYHWDDPAERYAWQREDTVQLRFGVALTPAANVATRCLPGAHGKLAASL